MSSTHEYHIDAEPDVGGKTSRHIIYYFILLAVLLFATLGGLTIMYRFQVAYQINQKIGQIATRESLDYQARMESILSGKMSVLDGKRSVPIEDAVRRFIANVREAR